MSEFDEMVTKEQFLELVALGAHPVNAGVAVGWSPYKTKQVLKDPEFVELLAGARDRADATIEEALYVKAAQGNIAAIQMWLFNRRPEEWRDVKRIEIKSDHQVSIGVVQSVKQGVLELLREQGVGAMQALGAGEIIDIEEIE